MGDPRPTILLTNDDGVTAKGLLALADSLVRVGEVSVIAPNHNWSAAGHSKTMHKPLRVTPVELENGMKAHATNGAPSDCVAMALLGFLGEGIQMIFSGVNSSLNLGHDVTYSGTVAAAMEGAVSGVPSVAISLDGEGPEDLEGAASFAAGLARKIVAEGLPRGTFLNVNVPGGEVKGTEITRLGQRVYRDALIERRDPRGESYYWIGGEAPGGLDEEGTDVWAVGRGRVSVTPLQLDMTNHPLLEELRSWRLDRVGPRVTHP